MTRAEAASGPIRRRAPLGQEVVQAARAVLRVLQGQALRAALERVEITAASRAAVAEFSYQTLRQLGTVRALTRRLATREPEPIVAAVLWVSLAQLLQARRPEAIVIDQVIDAARGTRELARAGGFLNAVLRRFVRERGALLGALADDVEATTNHQVWWVEQLRSDWPDDWRAIVELAQTPAPLTLRINARRAEPQTVIDALRRAGLEPAALAPRALTLAGAGVDVTRLPGFADGWFSVQDFGAQLAALLLDPRPGERVLDACAAPGGKTTHLLELADCDVTALDNDAERLTRVQDNLRRLGLVARTVMADAREVGSWSDGRLFDRILLDAPCTASGIVRRHPDIRWHRQRGDIETVSGLQRQLLARLWPQLKPGGKMLYATCSLFRAENEAVIGDFLERTPQARRVPLKWAFAADAGGQPQFEPISQLLPTSRPQRTHDGFFYALLEKNN